MSEIIKNQKKILEKLGIEKMNKMQEEMQWVFHANDEIVLLSPTGSGKTLAFLLPIVSSVDRNNQNIQALILVPSRELAIQIHQVAKEMGAGLTINAVYGGRPFSKDKLELQSAPSILIGTPGRVADHFRRNSFSLNDIETLVLDEFDKSLEIGFYKEMEEITDDLKKLNKKVLTSATQGVQIPDFLKLKKPKILSFLADGVPNLKVKTIISPFKDKLETLVKSIHFLGDKPGIIFCNYKDSIERVSTFLKEHKIKHGCYHGGLEQVDRERTLIKFRNGSHKILIATDLAARGLDIPEIGFIIHYHLPIRKEEFTHRNGRTARMHREGTAYVLRWSEDPIPGFIETEGTELIGDIVNYVDPIWATLFVSGGRKDKISKGDIAGLFFKQGKLEKDELGIIELKRDCAFVAVPKDKTEALAEVLNNSKIKKRKVRIYPI